MTTTQTAAPLRVRAERAGDADAIRSLLDRTFDGEIEGRIVDALRVNQALLCSLVAERDGEILGHIAFSPASLGQLTGAGLGPMAVRPDHQRGGIGAALLNAGLEHLVKAACPFVIVVGHAEYYPRFGFVPASRHGVRCEWELPDEVFMIRVLDAAAMQDATGLARYRPEFGLAAAESGH